MNIFKDRLTFRIPFFTTGKAFDPAYQERTDAVDDLVKQKSKEDEEKLKKQFDNEDKVV